MLAYLGRNHCYPGGGCPRCKGVVFLNKYIYLPKSGNLVSTLISVRKTSSDSVCTV